MSYTITTQPTPSAPPSYREAVTKKEDQPPSYNSELVSGTFETSFTAPTTQAESPQVPSERVETQSNCCCDPYYDADNTNCLLWLFCNVFCRPCTDCYLSCGRCCNDCGGQPSNVRRPYRGNNSYPVNNTQVDNGYGSDAWLCCDCCEDGDDWGCGECEGDGCGDCGGDDCGDWGGGDGGGGWDGRDDTGGGDDGGGWGGGDDTGGGDDGGGWGGGDDTGGGDDGGGWGGGDDGGGWGGGDDGGGGDCGGDD